MSTKTAGQADAPEQGQKKPPNFRILNWRRLNELQKLAKFYTANGVVIDRCQWLPVILHAMIGAYGDIDLPFVRDQFSQRGFPLRVDDDTLVTAIHLACGSFDKGRPYTPPWKAGPAVGLTKTERRELGIVTMQARDETKGERLAYVAESRKVRDAERKREARARAGATPREQSEARLKPWEAAGISKRTWYRKKAAGGGNISSADNLTLEGERTNYCHSGSEPLATTCEEAVRTSGGAPSGAPARTKVSNGTGTSNNSDTSNGCDRFADISTSGPDDYSFTNVQPDQNPLDHNLTPDPRASGARGLAMARL